MTLETLPPMNSRELSVISAALLLLASAACLALAVTITRRVTRRPREVNIILLAFIFLGAHYIALGAGRMLGGGLGAIGPQTQFFLLAGGELLGLLFFALCAHFMLVARQAAAREAREGGPTLPANEPRQGAAYGWLVLGVYGPTLLLAAARYVWAAERAGWSLGSQAVPFGAAETGSLATTFPVVIVGCFVGFLLAAQLITIAELCPSLQGRGGGSRPRRLIAFLFSGGAKELMSGPGARGEGDPGGVRAFLLAREFNALIALTNGANILTFTFAFNYFAGHGPLTREIVRTCFDLWPLHMAFLLVYYKTRLVFLDVIVKRGALAALLLGAGITSSALALAALPVGTARPGPLALGAGVAGFAACWLICHRRLERALDRYHFRRPDFARLEDEIGDEMRRSADTRSLLDSVAARIREAFGADYVHHTDQSGGDPTDGMTAEVALKADGRHWGFLRCGPRQRGQLYRSEDLAFLATIGAQAAGMHSNFALREDRETRERRERELRALATQAELRALRAQVNPHFLFNALTSLADLTRDDPALAEAMVLNLAHVFRFALNTSRREEVALGEEADFLAAYLEVERMRFDDRLSYKLRIPQALRDLRIPPMLIQPLVENAVLHGITMKPGGGRVEVSALLDRGRLRIRVADDGLGFDPAGVTPGEGTGFGLESVRARVELLSGPGHWRISSAPGAGTVVEFEVEVKVREIIETGFIVS